MRPNNKGDIQGQDVVDQETNDFFKIQRGFIEQLKRINSDLLNKHIILAGNLV